MYSWICPKINNKILTIIWVSPQSHDLLICNGLLTSYQLWTKHMFSENVVWTTIVAVNYYCHCDNYANIYVVIEAYTILFAVHGKRSVECFALFEKMWLLVLLRNFVVEAQTTTFPTHRSYSKLKHNHVKSTWRNKLHRCETQRALSNKTKWAWQYYSWTKDFRKFYSSITKGGKGHFICSGKS